ncbi:MAG: response regulator [Lachnospiraceae bacterium]|nr:response regulator [Lachnospiraceae bacterium]
MFRKVLITAPAESFIVKGLETKLDNIGVASVYAPPRLNALEGYFEVTDLVILYTDDEVEEYAKALVYIKDKCTELDKQVIVIGAKLEYETVKEHIPDFCLLKFYERPLDMEMLLNDVEKYLENESEYERRKSLLIVDDDVSFMSMITDWLKGRYRVSMVNSGLQAIKWLSNNRADLILLDYEMPVTSGPRVLEMLRSDVSTADLPVMFLTGKSDKESIMKVLALKPVGYQLKTITKDKLIENIEKFFLSQKRI